MNSKVKKGIKISLSVIFYIFIGIILLFSIANIRQKDKQSEYPNLFGYGFLTVQSDSMNGAQKDSFKKGDLIIVKTVNEKNLASLKAGDIITFYDINLKTENKLDSCLNTHRLVYHKGESFVTQGDYAAETIGKYDPDNMENNIPIQNYFEEIGATNIRGIYTTKISGFGNVITHIQSNFFWYIVLPVILFLCFQIFSVTRNILDYKSTKNGTAMATDREQLKADIKAEMEAEKELMRQEILAQMKSENDSELEKERLRAELLAELKREQEVEAIVIEETSFQETKTIEQKEEVKEPKAAITAEIVAKMVAEDIASKEPKTSVKQPVTKTTAVKKAPAAIKKSVDVTVDKLPVTKTTAVKKAPVATKKPVDVAVDKLPVTKTTMIKKAPVATKKPVDVAVDKLPVTKTTAVKKAPAATKKPATAATKKTSSTQVTENKED